MTLVQAPALGLARYANDRQKESWSRASDNVKTVIIRAVYRQVLGQQYVMENERLGGAESLFNGGALRVREFVRTVAKSGLYRSRFFDHCNSYRFIELNFKHLLGRAPQNKAEMLQGCEVSAIKAWPLCVNRRKFIVISFCIQVINDDG